MVFRGFQGFRLEATESLLDVVTQLIKRRTDGLTEGCHTLESPAVGYCLFGLQRCTDTAETRVLLDAFAQRVAESDDPLDPQQASRALFGLQSFVDSVELRALLRVLVPRIDGSGERFEESHFQYAFCALHGLKESPEARELIAVLTNKVKHLTEEQSRVLLNHPMGVERLEPATVLESLGDSKEVDRLRSLLLGYDASASGPDRTRSIVESRGIDFDDI